MSKNNVIVILSVSLVLVLGFQNCAKEAGFEAVDSDLFLEHSFENEFNNDGGDDFGMGDNSLNYVPPVVQVDADRDPQIDGPDVMDPEDEVEIKVFDKKIDPFEPLVGKMNVTLIVDNSKSNVDNVRSVMNGVENLLKELSPENTYIEVYTVDHMLDYSNKTKWKKLFFEGQEVDLSFLNNKDDESSDSDGVKEQNRRRGSAQNLALYHQAVKRPGLGSVQVSSHMSKRKAPLYKIDGEGLSDIDWQIETFKLKEKVEAALSVVGGGFDKNPAPLCGMISQLARADYNESPNDRNVVLIVTDEDSNEMFRKCRQESKSTSTVVSFTESISLSFHHEMLRTLEGGEKRWVTLSPGWSWLSTSYFSTCAEAKMKPHLVDKLFTSSTRRLTDKTHSSCTERRRYNPRFALHDDLDSTYEMSWLLDEKYEYGQVPKGVDELSKIIHSPDHGQVFVGLFSLHPGDPRHNSDQEAAVKLTETLNAAIPRNRFYQQSLMNRNYSQFIDYVVSFKNDTEMNRFSISDLLENEGDNQVHITQVQIKLNGMYESVSFSVQGDQLVIHGLAMSINDGAEIKISYHN